MNQYKYLTECDKEIQLKGLSENVASCVISDNMIVYGTAEGKVKVYHLAKNEVVHEAQLFEHAIIELAVMRHNGHFLILGFGVGDRKVKAIVKASNESKFQQVDSFGEMNACMSSHKLAFQITPKPTIFALQDSRQQIELLEIN